MTADGRSRARAQAPGKLLSFQEFVDDALFHPRWGYYATGAVRFGLGGHYDTYPLALSPFFGAMVAARARRVWRDAGEPSALEICEIGAGNGQLALDVLAAISTRSSRSAAWRRFARAVAYRIIERSAVLARRQRVTLGGLAGRVRWSRGDLSRRPLRGSPVGDTGLVFSNEVFDCFAPHRVVPTPTGAPRATYVAASLAGRRLDRSALARAMADPALRRRVRFREALLPVATAGGLARFLDRHYPELVVPGPAHPPYFACPQIGPFLRNAARLYVRSEAIFIDYGHTRRFHLTAPEHRRVFAGPPRSGATVYSDPGRHDVTVMVDFSVVRTEAERAGWQVKDYGAQGLLARGSGLRLDDAAVEHIARARALGWLLGALGVDPEQEWRRRALTWSSKNGRGGSLLTSARRAVDEFLGARKTPFRLVRLRRGL
jgi:SAM-dependent MidA family methyltransferase